MRDAVACISGRTLRLGASATRPVVFAVMKQVTKLRNGRVMAFDNTFERMDAVSAR